MSVKDDNDDDDGYDFVDANDDDDYSSTNFDKLEAVKPKKIVFSEDLNKLFPKAEEVFNKEEKIKNEIALLNYNNIMKELNRSQIPLKLDFFVGGEENMDLQNKIIQLSIDEDGLEFLSYLQSEYCDELMKRNKIKIHLESGNLFFNNKDSGESIYSFFLAKSKYTKILMPIEFEISDNYENYILEYIHSMKNRSDNKYDMLTHKNSEFLFYNFNNFLNRIGQQPN